MELKATERNGLAVGSWDPAFEVLSTDLMGEEKENEEAHKNILRRPHEDLLRELDTNQQ